MDIFTLIVAALATWQAVEIWHHSALFSTWRARIESYDTWWSQLLLCPFCLSPWVALLFIALLYGGPVWPDNLVNTIHMVIRLPAYALATSRLANLGNDLVGERSRTPRHNKLELPDDDDPKTAFGKADSKEQDDAVQ